MSHSDALEFRQPLGQQAGADPAQAVGEVGVVEDLATKSRSTIIWASITLSMYNLGRVARALPPKVMMDCGLDFDRWYPKARQMAAATALLATQPWDAPRYRKTLDTLGQRFDVQVGRVDH